MSIQAKILNFMLKKYVKNVQPPVEDRSYVEARKMMNQNGYTEEEISWGAKLIQNLIFSQFKSDISVNEIHLKSIRALHLSHDNFKNDKLYYSGRKSSASTATGLFKRHVIEQEELIDSLFRDFKNE